MGTQNYIFMSTTTIFILLIFILILSFRSYELLGDTSQILITMFIVYNLPSFHLAYILICHCLAPTLFRVVASTHSLYLIITGTPPAVTSLLLLSKSS